MSDVAIRVENLGKMYRIGARQQPYKTLRDTLVDALYAPFRRARSTLQRSNVEHANGKDTIWALKDVSFEVKRGEVVGVIGRNGAGKSTLLKILSRITEPTGGYAEIRGRVGSLLEVGTGFHPELTGRENIYLNGAILGMKKAEIDRKFDEIVAFAEIEKFLDTPVKRYSSGMYVRLAFAVAAYLESEILLVDEVLAVGDAEFQKKCLGKMGAVAKEGRTVLLVSHNTTAVKTLCPRAMLVKEGRLVEDGPSSVVVNAHLRSGRMGGAEVIWEDRAEAPGNELSRLRSVRVRDAQGRTASQIDSQYPFDIEIEHWNLRSGSKLGATVVLCNEEGQCVFSSLSNREPNWHGRPRPEGLFRTKCRVPGALLPEGRFSVSVLLWADNYTSAHREDNVVEFDIQDSGGARGDYFGGWSGVVRPLLDWTAEYVDAEGSLQPLVEPNGESAGRNSR